MVCKYVAAGASCWYAQLVGLLQGSSWLPIHEQLKGIWLSVSLLWLKALAMAHTLQCEPLTGEWAWGVHVQGCRCSLWARMAVQASDRSWGQMQA